MAPELVILDCGLTHVLQVPNTESYHSLELDGLGLYVRLLSLLIDKIMLDRAPLQCFSETLDCRVVKPENWVSKLNSLRMSGVICGVVTPKDNVWSDKTPLQKKLEIFGRSWGTFKLFCKKGCTIQYCWETFLQH